MALFSMDLRSALLQCMLYPISSPEPARVLGQRRPHASLMLNKRNAFSGKEIVLFHNPANQKKINKQKVMLELITSNSKSAFH